MKYWTLRCRICEVSQWNLMVGWCTLLSEFMHGAPREVLQWTIVVASCTLWGLFLTLWCMVHISRLILILYGCMMHFIGLLHVGARCTQWGLCCISMGASCTLWGYIVNLPGGPYWAHYFLGPKLGIHVPEAGVMGWKNSRSLHRCYCRTWIEGDSIYGGFMVYSLHPMRLLVNPPGGPHGAFKNGCFLCMYQLFCTSF